MGCLFGLEQTTLTTHENHKSQCFYLYYRPIMSLFTQLICKMDNTVVTKL